MRRRYRHRTYIFYGLLACRRCLLGLVAVGAVLTAAVRTGLSAARAQTGLVTIESDQQLADNNSGVVTALGNVRLIHPERGVVATSRQAQYFTKEDRIVLSGDVDVSQTDGTSIRAERLTFLLSQDRAIAQPAEGAQVVSQWVLQQQSESEIEVEAQ